MKEKKNKVKIEIIKSKIIENERKEDKTLKSQMGITLITLVIMILIIIILAGITISATLGDNGLLKQAQDVKDMAENSVENYGDKMQGVLDEYTNIMSEPPEPEKSEIVQAREDKTVFDKDTPLKDEHDNVVVVPEGFKVAEESGDTVQQGVVIEDVSASGDANVQGSQFVWIPVGTFTKDDGTKIEITLGRYTFDTTNGTPHLEQAAYTDSNPTNYENSVVIAPYYSEIAGEHRDGVASSRTDGLNATAKNLATFVNSAKINGGYYIGRYEASFASGTSINNYKAATKVSAGYSESSMSYASETLWNYITQLDASTVAINTYNGTNVESDLMNSYAWDTAVVYIQEATGLNYANKTGVNEDLTDTGKTGDEVCKINDMASNLLEWTTEYSNYVEMGMFAFPTTYVGGCYGNTNIGYTSRRTYWDAIDNNSYLGFRLCLYVK